METATTHLHSLEVLDGPFDVPVVVLQAIFSKLKVKTRAQNDILHASTLWLGLRKTRKSITNLD